MCLRMTNGCGDTVAVNTLGPAAALLRAMSHAPYEPPGGMGTPVATSAAGSYASVPVAVCRATAQCDEEAVGCRRSLQRCSEPGSVLTVCVLTGMPARVLLLLLAGWR